MICNASCSFKGNRRVFYHYDRGKHLEVDIPSSNKQYEYGNHTGFKNVFNFPPSVLKTAFSNVKGFFLFTLSCDFSKHNVSRCTTCKTLVCIKICVNRRFRRAEGYCQPSKDNELTLLLQMLRCKKVFSWPSLEAMRKNMLNNVGESSCIGLQIRVGKNMQML